MVDGSLVNQRVEIRGRGQSEGYSVPLQVGLLPGQGILLSVSELTLGPLNSLN